MAAKRREHLASSDLFMLAAAILFVAQSVLFRRFRLDDAYIAYRHARNLGDGLGPVMNAGERVEGVSNLPWTALLGAFSAAGLEPQALAPALSWIAGFVFLGLVATLAARAAGARRAGGLAALLGAAAAPLPVWSVSGMETVAFAALCCALFLQALRDLGRRGGSTGLWLGGVACLRPEGLVYFLPLLVAAPRRWRWLATVLLVALAMLGALSLCRWLYYGSVLPNPVHAKASLGAAAIAPGLLYVAKAAAAFPLFTLALVWVALRAGDTGRLLAAWCATTAVVALLVGGERIPGYRLLVPALPAVAVSAELALRHWAHGAPRRVRRLLVPMCVLAALGLFFAVWPHLLVPRSTALLALARTHAEPAAHAARLGQEIRFLSTLVAAAALGGMFLLRRSSGAAAAAVSAPHAARPARAVVAFVGLLTLLPSFLDPALVACRLPDPAVRFGRPVGEWLRRHFEASTLVATNCAGSLPYFAELPVVDMLGLADAHIARVRPDRQQWIGHEKGDGAYVLSRRPDIIILGGPQGSVEPWPFPGDRQLATSSDFQRDYALRRVRVQDFDFVYYERSERSSK